MTKVKSWVLGLATALAATSVLAFAGCSGDDGAAGKAGPPGEGGVGQPGDPCTVTQAADCATITCPGTSPVTVCGKSGADGGVGTCTVAADPDAGVGCMTITCSDNTRETVCNGTNPEAGPIAPGAGLQIDVGVSDPTNTTHFVAGEQITLTFTIKDASGNPLPFSDLKRANLYMAGPRDVLKTKTAVKLLRATTDRSQTPHHYIDLVTSTDTTNLDISGNVVTYTLAAITDEEPGTYKVGLWSEAKANPLDQTFALKDVQIGTATAETTIVGNCDDCHKGGANGVMYLHHIDPGYLPTGLPALDSVPVDTCINCHNQEGYAAVRICSDGTVPIASGTPATYSCADTTKTVEYMSDPIIRRVHGVHNGEELLNAFNKVDFEDYEHVVFPANVKNCAKCHTTDAWNAKPSRQACGACHDAVDFASGSLVPPRPVSVGSNYFTLNCTNDATCVAAFGTADTKAACSAAGVCQGTTGVTDASCRAAMGVTTAWATGTTTKTCRVDCKTNTDCSSISAQATCVAGKCEVNKHGGNAQTTDTACAFCHNSSAITDSHKVDPPAYGHSIELAMDVPSSGYYTTESPKITVTVKDGNGATVNPATITEASFNRLYLFVSGPRGKRMPVLTTAAAGSATAHARLASGGFQDDDGWDFTGATELKLKIDGTDVVVGVTAGMAADMTKVTAAEIVAWLNANAAFALLAEASVSSPSTTTAYGSTVVIVSKKVGTGSSVQALASTTGTNLQALLKFSTTAAVPSVGSYASNDIRDRTNSQDDDPKVVARTATAIEYQLGSVSGLAPGTYVVFVQGRATSTAATATAVKTFQIGTATEDKKIATNCADCHTGTYMHGSYPFDVDVCGSCHDYNRQYPARTGGALDGWGASAATGRSNMGFGAGPISRRVHGVHFLEYLNKPGEVHSSFANSHFIFPQDVRNCEKCHSESDSWKQKPSRLACMACHDSDTAVAHGALMTSDPTPIDPWNGDEVESCATCHGTGKEYAVDLMHNITNPYVPPYPR